MLAIPIKTYSAFSQETLRRSAPQNNTHTFIHEHKQLFSSEYKKKSDVVHWKVYKDVFVVSKGSATADNKLVLESVHYVKPSFLLKTKAMTRSVLYKKKQDLTHAILLTDDYSTGYFHWLADVLPRVIALEELYKQDPLWKDAPILIPDSYFVSYCALMLEIFGIDYNTRCIRIYKFTKVAVKKILVIGDIVAPLGSGNYRPQLMQKLRSCGQKYVNLKNIKVPQIQNKTCTKNIYIGRQDASYRYLENESVIIDLLCRYNFTIVQMSKISFLQQIALCAQADVLMSLHGAGLTNMLWMNKGTKLIEIRRNNDCHNNCYFSLASDLGIKYFYLLASATSTHSANFTLDYTHTSHVLSQVFSNT